MAIRKKRGQPGEQQTLIAVLLMLTVMWVWSSFVAPPVPPPEAVPGEEIVESTPGGVETPATSGTAPTAEAPTAVPERVLAFGTDAVEASFTSVGGGLRDIVLPKHSGHYEVEPIWRRGIAMVTGKADGDWEPYGQEPDAERIVSDVGLFLAAGSGSFAPARFEIRDESPLTSKSSLVGGLQITHTLRRTSDPELFELSVRFENAGTSEWVQPRWVGALDTFEGEAGRYDNVMRPTGLADGDLETLADLSDVEEGPETFQGAVSWLGIADRYFLAAMMPAEADWGSLQFGQSPDGRQGAFLVRSKALSPGEAEVLDLDVYIGPKQYDTLAALGYDLEKSVDFGFFGLFARILLALLKFFHSLVGNWGVAIILLTVTVKLAFFPLTQKSFASSRAMQRLQPEIAKLKEKYEDDPQGMGQAQMELFKKEGVNPLAGCLPMIVQMPVWFALYSVLLTASEVYHAEFLYLKDLSSVDPLGAFPFVVGLLMILQQRIQPMSASMDPLQQKMIRLMPLVFTIFIFAFPSGLAVYILVNTSLSIFQMWRINRANPLPVAAQPA